METVEPNKVVVEFTGEVIRLDAAYTREEKYDEMEVVPNMFQFDDEYVSFLWNGLKFKLKTIWKV